MAPIDFKGVNGPGANQGNVSQSRTNGGAASKGEAGQAGTSSGSDDTVELSPAVQTLQQLEARIRDLPEVNQERVDAIRTAIDEGRFEINAERIAARLITLERNIGS